MGKEVETVTGTVIDVRGPFHDGSYELDLETLEGEEVTIAISAAQYAELISEHAPASTAVSLN